LTEDCFQSISAEVAPSHTFSAFAQSLLPAAYIQFTPRSDDDSRALSTCWYLSWCINCPQSCFCCISAKIKADRLLVLLCGLGRLSAYVFSPKSPNVNPNF